jgi:hypothetical protein
MKATHSRRLGILAALVLSLLPMWFGRAGDAPPLKTEYFKGKVVPLVDALAKFGAKLDADAAPHWLALVTEGGKVYPLIKDASSRMFFKDAKLLNRSMRVTGRLYPGSHLLQVVNVHSYLNGQLHEVYYWCDICTIRTYEQGICDCCGGPMEKREVPVK